MNTYINEFYSAKYEKLELSKLKIVGMNRKNKEELEKDIMSQHNKIMQSYLYRGP